MAATLPRPVRLRLQQTLGQWQHWQLETPLSQPPVPTRVLTSGLSNFNVLVEAGRQFVVRLDGLDPAAIGLNRQAEWRALQNAAQQGLAPTPRYRNPELGSLVCDYLEPDTDTCQNPGTVARLLQGIHRLPPVHARLDLRERMLRYEHRLADHDTNRNALSLSRREALAALEQLEIDPTSPVLCHNDLLAANRVTSGGTLWALDWEYCAMGDPLFDLAVVAVGDQLDPAETGDLLTSYLGRQPDEASRRRLYWHSTVYRYLEQLWYAAYRK